MLNFFASTVAICDALARFDIADRIGRSGRRHWHKTTRFRTNGNGHQTDADGGDGTRVLGRAFMRPPSTSGSGTPTAASASRRTCSSVSDSSAETLRYHQDSLAGSPPRFGVSRIPCLSTAR
jgi:hypothetical protein